MKIRCPCCQAEFEAAPAIAEQAAKDTKRMNFLEEFCASIFTDLNAQVNGDFKLSVRCSASIVQDVPNVFSALTYRSAIDRAITAYEKNQEDTKLENIAKRVERYKAIYEETVAENKHILPENTITQKRPKPKWS